MHTFGSSWFPTFTPGKNWVKHGDFYYYTLPVAPDRTPAANLIDTITLTGSYNDNDADGGKQVIEVMAEAIQSQPETAVGEAWGVKIAPNSVTAYNPGN